MTIDIKKLEGVARNSVKKTFGKQFSNEFLYNSLKSDANCRAYYRWENNANDTQGNYNLTANNMTYGTSITRFGYAGIGNGTTGYCSMANINWSNTFSFATWAYFTDNTAARIADCLWDSQLQRYLDTANPNKYHPAWWLGASNMFGATALSLNTWYHIVGVTNGTGAGTSAFIYVNGAQDAAGTNTQTISRATDIFGRTDVRDNASYRMKGYMDDTILFNRALTATEVLAIYTGQVKKYMGKGNIYA